MTTCIGLCSRIGKGGLGGGKSPYREGWARCMYCEKFLFTEEINCPCCHLKMRRRAQDYKTKRKIAGEFKRI